MRQIGYKGYLINLTTRKLADSGEWTSDITIAVRKTAATIEKRFSREETYSSEEEAVSACIEFGKRIIDGQIEGLSVRSL